MLERLTRSLIARDIFVPEEQTLLDELDNAKLAINIQRRVLSTTEVPPLYESVWIELCIEAISKYGAEGEDSHSENGIVRSYDNASPYSNTTLNKIIPRIGIC